MTLHVQFTYNCTGNTVYAFMTVSYYTKIMVEVEAKKWRFHHRVNYFLYRDTSECIKLLIPRLRTGTKEINNMVLFKLPLIF